MLAQRKMHFIGFGGIIQGQPIPFVLCCGLGVRFVIGCRGSVRPVFLLDLYLLLYNIKVNRQYVFTIFLE